MKTKLVRPVLVKIKYQDHYPILGINAFDKKKELFLIEGNKDNSLDFYYYQLIFISLDLDEKIEVGDRVIYQMEDGHITDLIVDNTINTHPERWLGFKKVIATQDQLPPEYIQQFIEEYNKGEAKNVEIEMECPECKQWGWINTCRKDCNQKFLQPKLTNGFVTIVEAFFNLKSETDRPIYSTINKQITYTEEEEVYRLCGKTFLIKSNNETILGDFNKWWKQNKKK